ncbi:MAG: asparagine synthase (glutamine-hydrolyzing) [Candidatus Stahlbacteria bacterium]|nr:asparagine synthase (glutamine-hydrolyzing) [Candidatus Stahlbacteria bacterium]
MSGICGFWSFKKASNINWNLSIQEMIKVISHRGQDDVGTYFGSVEQIGLAITRLSILDCRKGLYPLHNEDNSLYLILDGEIYNFKPIKERLLKLGHKFYTETSEEIILHLYEEQGAFPPNPPPKWGKRDFADSTFISELNGNFAFALWDSKNKTLLIARDRLGIKPLYYWMDKDKLLFGSEIKVLFVDSSVPREPNDAIIYDFLVTGVHEHTEDTFFKGIKKLSPGEYMIISQHETKQNKYWNLENVAEGFSLPLENESKVISKFSSLFESSVKIRLMGEVEIGTLLSGGMDSSSVVAILNKLHSTNGLKAFSSCREDIALDERKYIEPLARLWGLNSCYNFPTSGELWAGVRDFIYAQEEPVRGASTYDHFSVMKMAHEQGIKVLFDGQGSDETLYGYIAYFPQFLWQIKYNIPKLFKELIAGYDLVNFAIRERLVGKLETQKFLSPDFANEFRGREHQIWDELFPCTLAQKSYYAITKYSLPFLLKETERNASAFGIETRIPFIDNELIEFSYSLPLQYKIRDGWTKWILRQAMRSLLPDIVLKRRRKVGFGTPEARWLKELSPQVKELFESREFTSRAFWDAGLVIKRFNDFCAGKIVQPDLFWRLIFTEIWLRTFFT